MTTIPIGRSGRVEPSDIGHGAVYFPFVGAGVGAVSALSAFVVSLVLPAAVAALAAVGVGALLTGALHFDGLADTADSYAARTKGRALDIMRDHAVGSYGVVALILDIGLRVALVAALLPRPRALLFLVAAGALSRSAAVGLGAVLPGARTDGGLRAVLEGVGPWRAGVAIVLGVGIAILSIGWAGVLAALITGGAAVIWGLHCLRRLGGMTGDTLGVASEGGEVLVLVLGAAIR